MKKKLLAALIAATMVVPTIAAPVFAEETEPEKELSEEQQREKELQDMIAQYNQKKNDPEYISYLQNGDSAAVFIVRDIVKSVNTSGMWIDILSTSGGKNEYGKWDFSSITIELFPRKIKPVYPEYSSIADKKYITWKTANEDISKQR